MQQINVDIDAEGGIRIDAVGFSGPDCEQATRFLEEALGQVRDRQRKPEWHQRGTRRQTQRLGR